MNCLPFLEKYSILNDFLMKNVRKHEIPTANGFIHENGQKTMFYQKMLTFPSNCPQLVFVNVIIYLPNVGW